MKGVVSMEMLLQAFEATLEDFDPQGKSFVPATNGSIRYCAAALS